MIGIPKLSALALAGLGLGAASSAATLSEGSDAVSCEIVVDRHGSMTSLDGIVHAAAPVRGSYRFRLAKSGGGGNADIDQAGEFTADRDQKVTLTSTTLGTGGRYSATLEVTPDGMSGICSDTISGAL